MIKPTTQGIAMTETAPQTNLNPQQGFRKIVARGLKLYELEREEEAKDEVA